MSVIVKGMKMPKKCLWCPLQYVGFCQVTKTDVNSGLGRRADDCPLVELPDKHGRLIDGDEVITAFPVCDSNMDVKIESVRATIDHMPTVIEAEGEG